MLHPLEISVNLSRLDKSLRQTDNKIDLIKFLIGMIDIHASSLENKELYATCEQRRAYCITGTRDMVRSTPIPELESQQEEADTKIFLCASYSAELGFRSVKITTVDSDVAIL